jgi:hypothetical protein
MTPPTLLKQPLLHFLLLGALIFVAYHFTAEPAAEAVQPAAADRIDVSRAALLNYLQYQAQAFEPELFEARLAAMSEAEIAALTADYVREEALYREALKMNLDQGDYSIRQRLVQKVEFLLENLVTETINPDASELQAFFDARQTDYRVDAVYTFSHIFFDARQGGMDDARTRAARLLADSAGIAFEEAGDYGDRFPFLQNYVERTRDFVGNNFGADFVVELDTLLPDPAAWQGPLASRYGYHLVLLRERVQPFSPALQDISARVLDDYRFEAMVRSREEAEAKVVAEYDVVISLD